MASDEQIGELPLAYAVALRLDRAGASPDLIATALGVEREAVPSVLELAQRKLAERLAHDDAKRPPAHPEQPAGRE